MIDWKSLDFALHFSHVSTDLVMHEDVHDVQINLREPVILGFVREQDVLDAKQRDEDEGRPHRPHVEAGLGLVRHSQLGDENPNDVQQEEEVHLEVKRDSRGDL